MAGGAEPASPEFVAEGLRAAGVEPSTRPRILSCISGGADSTFLTWALVEAGCDVTCFHLDHQLREGSARDAEAADATARRLGVPITSLVAEIEVAEGSSPETAARHARYALAEDIAAEARADWIATGHTADDQIETFFINLARGAGLDGLAGIPPRRDKVIRPMLSVTHDSARAACESLGLKYVDDPSNEDRSILRNKIRHELVPGLAGVLGPGYRDAMLRQFGYLRGDAELLNALADVKVGASTLLVRGRAAAIDVDLIAGAHPALQRRVVRRALAAIGVETPPAGRFVDDALIVASEGGSADLGGGSIARREGDSLVIRPRILPVPQPVTGELPGRIESKDLGVAVEGEVLSAPATWTDELGSAWIKAGSAGTFVLRAPAEGERFAPQGMKGTKPLADFLADAGMLRTAREWAPVLSTSEGEVVWVIGRRISSRFAVPIGAQEAMRIRVVPIEDGSRT